MTDQLYLLISIGIGILLIIESLVLFKKRAPQSAISPIALLVAVAEFGWLVVSYQVWRDVNSLVPNWFSASFMAYFLAMTFAGIQHAIKTRDQPEMQLPDHLLLIGGIFGLYFGLAAMGCWYFLLWQV
ncbi:MAG: hypothetical protein VXW65_03105 [Pseudomonadota bacterium]|nr:hypothetical protein [Pseudomonadota bacterium]